MKHLCFLVPALFFALFFSYTEGECADKSSLSLLQERVSSLTPERELNVPLFQGATLLGISIDGRAKNAIAEGGRRNITLFIRKDFPTEPDAKPVQLSLHAGKDALSFFTISLSHREVGEVFLQHIDAFIPVFIATEERFLSLNSLKEGKAIPLGMRVIPRAVNHIGVVSAPVKSLLRNGSFEDELRRTGYDMSNVGVGGWMLAKGEAGIAVGFDNKRKYDGKRSLALNIFEVGTMNWYHLVQDIEVKPRSRYSLRYFLLDVAEGDSGPPPGVEVFLGESSAGLKPIQLSVVSPKPTFTQKGGWKEHVFQFETKKSDRLLRLRLRINISDGTIAAHNGKVGGSWRIDRMQIEELR